MKYIVYIALCIIEAGIGYHVREIGDQYMAYLNFKSNIAEMRL